MSEQGVQEGTEHRPLRGPSVEDQRCKGDVNYPHDLGSARQEVQDPVAEGGIQSQGPKVGEERALDNGVELVFVSL